jgi:O-antigen/teichoic acid export membrane protein
MHIHKSVVINFAGGAWLGLLIVATTPWYVADLGLEGFALIGIWQLLFYIALVFDFGFGAACARELARGTGASAGQGQQRTVFSMFELPVICIAAVLLVLIYLAAPWLAESWLDVRDYPSQDVAMILRLMAVAVALQFITAFYLNALAGLQHMATMNLVQIANNTVRYLGGAAMLLVTEGIVPFFVFQAIAAVTGLVLARAQVVPCDGAQSPTPSLREHLRFSGGMFVTAATGALLANADRIVLSSMVNTELLGRYTVALTAIGLLQTLVFAFHRAYYPRFAELGGGGDPERLKAVYREACALVGSILVPVALVFAVFTPELYVAWLGQSADDIVLVSRLLVVGFLLSGVMWLPAAYQQAIGWTRLHASLMLAALLLGLPLLAFCVYRFGLAGAAALMLLHGLIQITVGIALMNRVFFPGETWRWYRSVIVVPLLLSAPALALARLLMPSYLGRFGSALWIVAICAILIILQVVFKYGSSYVRRIRQEH